VRAPRESVLHDGYDRTGKAPSVYNMSVPDFLNWEPDDGFRYELVDGELRAVAPASTIHGFLQNELDSALRGKLMPGGSLKMRS
jgi:hypothetical protein